MKLSNRFDYGIRSLVFLALKRSETPIALSYIASENGISQQYLEQIFSSLRKSEIVKSVKGSQGGYLLTREPEDIKALELLKALEGNFKFESETLEKDSEFGLIQDAVNECIIDRLNEAINLSLEDVTLKDILDVYKKNSIDSSDMYYI